MFLQCLVGSNLVIPAAANRHAQEGGEGGAGPSNASVPMPQKRTRDDDPDAAFHAWLFDAFPLQGNETLASESKDAPAAEGCSDQVEETQFAAGGRKGSKRRAVNDAAVAKANRERARREKLNEYLDELSKLCDPAGKGFKADRVSVVADAIRVVQQLRVENNQLKQLNKFLEERVGHYEHARAQSMFQHVALASVGQSQGGQDERPGTEMGMQHMLVPVGNLGNLGSLGNCFSAQPAGGMGKPEQFAAAVRQAVPPASWLPAPNAHEDEKLRPPAA
jgi:hypothetical protein